MTTLLLSSRYTEDDQLLWRAAVARQWNIERVKGIRLSEINDVEIIIYVEALFAPEIARQLNIRLLDPDEDFLVKLPFEFKKRRIELIALEEARKLNGPNFIKPPNDKSFPAAVYEYGQLPEEFDGKMKVLVSETIEFSNEFRCFCLNNKVKTISPYLRSGVLAKKTDYQATEQELEEAVQFAEKVLLNSNLPRAIVLDVGKTNLGWVVVEANGAWGSGIYGCDPSEVLNVIQYAVDKI